MLIFSLLQQLFVRYDYPIHLINGMIIPRTTRSNITSEASLLLNPKIESMYLAYTVSRIKAILQQIYV